MPSKRKTSKNNTLKRVFNHEMNILERAYNRASKETEIVAPIYALFVFAYQLFVGFNMKFGGKIMKEALKDSELSKAIDENPVSFIVLPWMWFIVLMGLSSFRGLFLSYFSDTVGLPYPETTAAWNSLWVIFAKNNKIFNTFNTFVMYFLTSYIDKSLGYRK